MHHSRIIRIVFALFTGMLLATSGCVTDPDLSEYPVVSFDEVKLIIGGNCTQSGCHGNINPTQFRLVDYGEIRQKVTPGDARKSDLFRAITGRTEIMPPSPSDPLTQNQIAKIYLWIQQGAQDN